jgi:prepilin-type processing-associated H-X9-DG protein
VVAQIERIAQNDTLPERPCLQHKLSIPMSYAYNAYLAPTQSQICDTIWWMIQASRGNISGIAPYNIARYDVATLHAEVDPSCLVSNSFTGLQLRAYGNGTVFGDADIPDSIYKSQGLMDDDGSPLPDSYPRLKEGVERFMITDINNPAGAAQAQSSIFVMWDCYGHQYSNSGVGEGAGIQRFNHIPSGSNVLFMDGHVEFKRLNSGVPMQIEGLPADSVAGSPQHDTIKWLWNTNANGMG